MKIIPKFLYGLSVLSLAIVLVFVKSLFQNMDAPYSIEKMFSRENIIEVFIGLLIFSIIVALFYYFFGKKKPDQQVK